MNGLGELGEGEFRSDKGAASWKNWYLSWMSSFIVRDAEGISYREYSWSIGTKTGMWELCNPHSLAGLEGFSEWSGKESLRPDCRAPWMLSSLDFVPQVRKSCWKFLSLDVTSAFLNMPIRDNEDGVYVLSY